MYWIGSLHRQAGVAPPAALHWTALTPAALDVDLQTLYPHVRSVRFVLLGDVAHNDTANSVDAFLHGRYGAAAELRRLGRGGHQIAVRVCQPKTPCFVAKLRRLQAQPSSAAGVDGATQGRAVALRIEAEESAEALRRDLAMLQIAELVSRHALWLDANHRPRRPTIKGAVITPAVAPIGEPGRFVRSARLLRPAALADGIVEMELVDWRPSAKLTELLAGNVGANGATRDAIWQQAPTAAVQRVRAMAFADRYTRGSDLGPELYKLRTFVDDCHELEAVPKIAEICAQAQRDFALVDDLS